MVQKAYEKADLGLSYENLPSYEIKSVDEFFEIKAIYKQFKNPVKASPENIIDFIAQLKAHKIEIRDKDDQEKQMIFASYAKTLSEELILDALPFVTKYIILNSTWFPSIAEIMQAQNKFLRRYRGAKNILKKSLENFFEKAPIETIQQIVDRQDDKIKVVN